MITYPSANVNTSFRNSSSDSKLTKRAKSYSRPWIPPENFKAINQQKRMWAAAAIEESNLNIKQSAILEEIAFLLGPDGQGEPSLNCIIESLHKKKRGKITYSALSKIIRQLVNKGIITTIKRFKLTNVYSLVGFKHELANHFSILTDNINIKRDLKDPTTSLYEEYSIFDNSEKKENEALVTHVYTAEKFVNESNLKLSNEDAEAEIRRVALIFLLSDEKTRHAIEDFYIMKKRREVKNIASIVYSMIERLSNDSWVRLKIQDKQGADMNHVQTDKMYKEQLERDTKEKALAHARQRLKDEGHEYPTNVGKTHIEHLDALNAYGQKEAMYMMSYLKAPSGPRPVTVYPSNPDWQARYD